MLRFEGRIGPEKVGDPSREFTVSISASGALLSILESVGQAAKKLVAMIEREDAKQEEQTPPSRRR